MKVRILMGQRKVRYPGEYAPEVMIARDEYCLDDNWDGWEADKARAIASWGDDLAQHVEFEIDLDDDEIDRLFALPNVSAVITEER